MKKKKKPKDKIVEGVVRLGENSIKIRGENLVSLLREFVNALEKHYELKKPDKSEINKDDNE